MLKTVKKNQFQNLFNSSSLNSLLIFPEFFKKNSSSTEKMRRAGRVFESGRRHTLFLKVLHLLNKITNKIFPY